ncbi:TPA: DUF417 family protein, partial [Vibrio cholerae]|nr:DUF417 family protein [Vibrio cholerae]
MHDSKTHNLTTQYSYLIGVLGVSLILIWLGIYKFTPTEAKLIEPLVLNHPLMGWTYQFLSVQAVSNLIGATEIIVGIGLLIGLRSSKVAY